MNKGEDASNTETVAETLEHAEASLRTEPTGTCRNGVARIEPRRCRQDGQRGQRTSGDMKRGESKAKQPNADGERH